jgi:phosphatidate cytidylyltransferase
VNAKNQNLLLRVASALVLLPLVLWLLHQGGYATAGLIAVAAGLCAFEYYSITLKGLNAAAWLGVLGAAAMPLLPVWHPLDAWRDALWIVGGVFFVGWAFHLLRGPLADAPVRAAQLLTGLVYAAFGLTTLSALRAGPSGLMWIYAALIITWGNDTAAYFSGRFLGKHKLYPEVSPNKTWEGFFGGMAGSVLGLFIARATGAPSLRVGDCIVLGIAGGICGPIGDLCESMLKRAYDVKDSGKTLPGHGGMLDRIDALIFNGPMVFLYVAAVRGYL